MMEICIFDLYGTLVDIHTDEEKEELWEKLSLFYRYYGADYEPEELQTAFQNTVRVMAQEREAGNGKEEGREKAGREKAGTEKEGTEKERTEKAEGSEIVRESLRGDAHEMFPEIQIEDVFLHLFHKKYKKTCRRELSGANAAAERELAVHAGQFFRILSTDYVRLYEGTREMLAALKNSGKKIYLLSNAQRIFTEYEMNALGISQYFDGIFISSDYGYRKPDGRFYRELLESASIRADRAVMIGNDGICDIEGARRMGLSTVYIRSNLSPEEEIPQADAVLEEMDMERLTEILLEEQYLRKTV